MSRFATPGVYIKERNAFTSSVVQVPTAVPAFIGYTEKAMRGKNSLTNKPTRISSLAEYMSMFGGAPHTTFTVKAKGENDFELKVDEDTRYNLFNSMRLFYANGGGVCWIVSVGDYSKPVDAKSLNDPETKGGLQTLLTEQEPTMVVIPDAILLERNDCYSLYQQMLKHCGQDTKSRVAILDVHGGDQVRTYSDDDVITQFREGVGNNFLMYGASYYPWLKTTTVPASEISYKNISNINDLVKILTKEAENLFLGGASATPPPAKGKGGEAVKKGTTAAAKAPAGVDEKMLKKYEAVKAEIDNLKNADADPEVVNQNLKALSPMYKYILGAIREKMNLQCPAGAMAGIYSMIDNLIGVHKAPANVSVASVVAPSVNITSETQEDLNLPINGKAVNAIRGFVGKGVLVWGARTLDGNSQDWRYISVRRTMIMLEVSIKNAAEGFVFEPNTPQTWTKVKTSIDNFLTSQWKAGALVGPSTNEAFNVTVGLGQTMTPVDILDGIMRVVVKVCISRPAEFIEITFMQKMQEGGIDSAQE